MARMCRGKWGGPHDLDVVGRTKDGQCRACRKAYRAAYWKAYYEANREKELARWRDYKKQPSVAIRKATLQSLRRIRERRGRYEAQIRELLTQLGSARY